MDKTNQYIKMCDCPEIQHAKTSLERDGHSFHVNLPHPNYGDKFKRITWLPRQDQIQEMMGFVDLNHAMSSIYGFYADRMGKFGDKTWEQLWLAFYIYKKHSKIWSSKEEKWQRK